MRIRSRKNGFTILFAALVASVVLSIGAIIFSITFRELLLTSQVRDSNKAFYAADSALECALYWDTTHPGFSNSIFGGIQGVAVGGLMGHWRLDESAGSLTAADSSGGNKTGALTTMDPANDWVSGQIGGGLDFDGTNDHVVIPDTFQPTAYTVMAWVQPRDTTSVNIITRTADGNPTGAWSHQLRLTSSGFFQYYLWDGTGRAVTDTVAATAGTWYHVAGVSTNNGAMRLYVNGQEVGTPIGTIGTMWSGGNQYHLGSNTGEGMAYFNGVIDDVRMYDEALSGSEINSIFSQSGGAFVGPIDEGSANVQCMGSDINDSSTGWDNATWRIDQETASAATTTFDVSFSDGTCATVTVEKTDKGYGQLNSKGYNTCDLGNPRRIERALRVTY